MVLVYFSEPFYGGTAETTEEEMRGGPTVRLRRKEKKVRHNRKRGEEVGTVAVAVAVAIKRDSGSSKVEE